MSALIGLALVAVAADVGRPPDRLAADLGSPHFAVRERATVALWRLGEAARPALLVAAKGADPEAVRRAADLLDRFDWGVYADTPPRVRELVRRFRTRAPDDQHAALDELVRAGAVPTLRRLLGRPHPPADRTRLFRHLRDLLRREVPPLIVANDRDRAGELLALHALGADPGGAADLALFEHLRGKPEPVATTPVLTVFRRRAAGDLPGALAAATFPGLEPLQDALLEDAGEWAVLADRPIPRANSEAGLRAFRLRRAGRTAEADAILAAQPDLPLGPPNDSAQELDEPTLGLVLNDRSAAAIARLTREKASPHLLADWLAARFRFADALALVSHDGRRGPGYDDGFLRGLAGTRRGRLLARLGRRADAETAFADTFTVVRLQDNARNVADDRGYSLEQLVRAAVQAGRPDLACDYLGWAIGADRENRWDRPDLRTGAFEALFDSDAEVAEAVLGLLAPRGKPGDGLKRVRALLAGKGDPADLARVATTAVPNAATDPDRARRVGHGVAAVLRAGGRPADAAAVLEGVADALPPAAADPPRPRASGVPPGVRAWVYGTDERARFWVELGDTLCDLGRPADAAARLLQGWRRFPDNATLLFLSGRALEKAGQADGGRERMAMAHWVPLGNPRHRGRLLDELLARGLVADAERERPLAERAGWPGGPQVANVWNQCARAAGLAGDFPAAARHHRRAVHAVLLNPGVFFMDGAGYLTAPQQAAAADARGLLAAGKVPEAVAAADACLEVLPGNADLVIALVAGLDATGHRAEADRLFRRTWDRLRALVAEHPDTAWGRAEAAWLAAGCRRELDAALELADGAVERDPAGVLPRKALAEVRFRRGDRAGAVAVMQGLAADDRLSHLFRRQLDRYRTAPADSPPPDADDD